MESTAARLLELIDEKDLIPFLVTGTETAESLKLAAETPGLLGSACKLSLLRGVALEAKIKEFDLCLLEASPITLILPCAPSTSASATQNQETVANENAAGNSSGSVTNLMLSHSDP